MIKLFFLFLLILFFTLPLFAQSVNTAWVIRYNEPKSMGNNFYSIISNTNGNDLMTRNYRDINPYKEYSNKKNTPKNHLNIAGLYFGFGLGYESLNSSDLKIWKQVGLGEVRQNSSVVHGDVGAVFNLRYFMLSGIWSFYASAHPWKNCFGSGIDVDMYGRITDFEVKVGPCLLYIFKRKSTERKGDIVPFFLVGKTLRMLLKDENKDGFVEGEGPIFFGGGVDIVFLSKVVGGSLGLKYIHRREHSYKAFRIGQEIPLETKASPYSVTVTLGFMILPF